MVLKFLWHPKQWASLLEPFNDGDPVFLAPVEPGWVGHVVQSPPVNAETTAGSSRAGSDGEEEKEEAGSPIEQSRQNRNVGIPEFAGSSLVTSSDANSANPTPKCDQSEGKHSWPSGNVIAEPSSC
jgi:hypothetical protein